MSTDSGVPAGTVSLEITLARRNLPVSSLSSLLRVVQAAIREVARTNASTSDLFSQPPHPVLRVSAGVSGEDLLLSFFFDMPRESRPKSELSETTFDQLLGRLADFIKGLPQRGLWGQSVAGGRPQQYESEVARRLDELRMELRRFPRARLRYDQRSILFEGDRMEIA
jgi:hypothetical protein